MTPTVITTTDPTSGELDPMASAAAEAEAEAELKKGFSSLEVVRPNASTGVFYIYLNRPTRRNALTPVFFTELPRALALLDAHPAARALVLAARGPHFCAGIELSALRSVTSSPSPTSDPAAARELLRRNVLSMQSAITAIERCRKPVVAEIDGACIGGGIDLVTACDIRCCSEEAFFSVKEVDLGLAADLGTLQRLPAVVGFGNAADMALTGRRVTAAEAKGMGLVTRVFPSRQALEEGVAALAKDLAEKPSLAVMGTKSVLLKSRDLTMEQGLDYVATWNSAVLISHDLEEAVSAQLQKRKPVFSKL